MATFTTKPDLDVTAPFTGAGLPAWPRAGNAPDAVTDPALDDSMQKLSQRDALQALLAFSALHDQVRRRKALAAQNASFDAGSLAAEFEEQEQFVLDEVLQLVAERAIAITGADGVAIALAENNEIVLRASSGSVRPEVGARIDRDSAFSGACFRTAQVINCDDTEIDPRVNLQACRRLGARSMIAVPLCGRLRVIGLLEAFSAEPFGFNDSDICSLTLLAELVVGALKPEDEERFAQSAQAAAVRLEGRAAKPQEHVTSTEVAATSKSAASVEPATPAISKPATPTETKSVETKLAATNAVAIPKGSPTESHKVVASETLAAKATAQAPALAFAQARPVKTPRPGVVILLLSIVLAAAFAAGVWWKMKTAQLGSAIVTTEKFSIQPSATVRDETPPAPVPAVPDSNSAQADADTISSADEAADAPANNQEVTKFPRVTGIRHWSSADSSTVVLDLEDQVQYEEHQIANPTRYYYDLRDTQLAPELAGKSIDVGDAFLSRIRIAQPVAGMTRIVLDTKNGILAAAGVSLEPNPYRLVIQIRKPGTNPASAVNLFPKAPEAEKSKLAIVVPPPTKDDLQLRARVPKMRIVVDAGHGGWDLGTVGKRGLLEKDLVLEIAQRLGKLLETRLGSEVILTRNDDNYIPLDSRAEMANEAQADLFVSVHANYSDLPSARGVETYYTNFFSAPGSKDNGSKDFSNPAGPKEAAMRAAPLKNGATLTLTPAELHERVEQSRRLAASVQRSLYGILSTQNPGLRDRGIKEAGFVVLTDSAMPGILAEVSFVSSPTDEQKLRSDGYREEIAEALYKGIARYAASSKGVKVASK